MSRILYLVIVTGTLLLSSGCASTVLERQSAPAQPVETAEIRRLPPIETPVVPETPREPERVASTPSDDWGEADWTSVKGVTIRFE